MASALVNGRKKRSGRRPLVQPVLPALPVLAKSNKQKAVTQAVRPASPPSSQHAAAQVTEDSQSAIAETNDSHKPADVSKEPSGGLEAVDNTEINHVQGM